jgi:hypothetical protein
VQFNNLVTALKLAKDSFYVTGFPVFQCVVYAEARSKTLILIFQSVSRAATANMNATPLVYLYECVR